MPRARLSNANATRGHVVPLLLPWLAPSACNAPSTLVTASRRRPSPSPSSSSPSSSSSTSPYSQSHRPGSHLRERYADIADIAATARRNSTSQPPLRRQKLFHNSKQSRALALRRERHLELEQRRLAAYKLRQPNITHGNFLRQGQYRSLVRRVTNLKTWHATALDLGFTALPPSTKPHDLITNTFAALDRVVYSRMSSNTNHLQIKHAPLCVRWSAFLFSNVSHNNHDQLWGNWKLLDIKHRRERYLRLLIYLLDRKPGRALHFIQVLANDQDIQLDVRRIVIADALGHLARLHVRGTYRPNEAWDEDPAISRRRFAVVFLDVFRRLLATQPNICSQDLLYSVATLAEASVLRALFDEMAKHNTRIGFDTVLHYANRFAEFSDFQYALRCLSYIRDNNHLPALKDIVDRDRFRWTCALILRKSMSMSTGEEYHETPRIVAFFAELGVTMDTLLYNVVMHNAVEAGDYTTAFKVYNALEDNGLKPTKHTYSILLHGCTLQTNPAQFHRFAEHCVDVAKQMKDPWLATDYLYYLYVWHRDSPERAKWSLYSSYLRFFRAEDLYWIGNLGSRELNDALLRPRDEAERSSETANGTGNMTPPPMALYLILQTEVQEAASWGTPHLVKLYDLFLDTVLEKRNSTLNDLAKDCIIWNLFLHAFCEKQQFASASRVIKDMHSYDNAPDPNVYSWNILMQAFFKAGQVQAAERVIELMRDRGIQLDQFSYGVMLRGYARAQVVNRVGELMDYIDDDKLLEPDTLSAMACIADREFLMKVLEQSREAKAAKVKEGPERKQREEQSWLFTKEDNPTMSSHRQVNIDAASDGQNHAQGVVDQIRKSLYDMPAAPAESDFLLDHEPEESNITEKDHEGRNTVLSPQTIDSPLPAGQSKAPAPFPTNPTLSMPNALTTTAALGAAGRKLPPFQSMKVLFGVQLQEEDKDADAEERKRLRNSRQRSAQKARKKYKALQAELKEEKPEM